MHGLIVVSMDHYSCLMWDTLKDHNKIHAPGGNNNYFTMHIPAPIGSERT
jgi:hypothetical protein